VYFVKFGVCSGSYAYNDKKVVGVFIRFFITAPLHRLKGKKKNNRENEDFVWVESQAGELACNLCFGR
jgi:hypothetical protein